jgi:hypothetical protein
MPPVRRRVKQDVLRPTLDSAFQHGFQRFVGRVARLEGEVVAEDEEAMLSRLA